MDSMGILNLIIAIYYLGIKLISNTILNDRLITRHKTLNQNKLFISTL